MKIINNNLDNLFNLKKFSYRINKFLREIFKTKYTFKNLKKTIFSSNLEKKNFK
jgi:hypothetical protein